METNLITRIKDHLERNVFHRSFESIKPLINSDPTKISDYFIIENQTVIATYLHQLATCKENDQFCAHDDVHYQFQWDQQYKLPRLNYQIIRCHKIKDLISLTDQQKLQIIKKRITLFGSVQIQSNNLLQLINKTSKDQVIKLNSKWSKKPIFKHSRFFIINDPNYDTDRNQLNKLLKLLLLTTNDQLLITSVIDLKELDFDQVDDRNNRLIKKTKQLIIIHFEKIVSIHPYFIYKIIESIIERERHDYHTVVMSGFNIEVLFQHINQKLKKSHSNSELNFNYTPYVGYHHKSFLKIFKQKILYNKPKTTVSEKIEKLSNKNDIKFN